MIVTGREAPWEGVTQYGSWIRRDIPPDQLLFDWEGRMSSIAGHWEWVPPRPPVRPGSSIEALSQILKMTYLPVIQKQLDTPFLSLMEAELGTMQGRSERARRVEIRNIKRTLRKLLS